MMLSNKKQVTVVINDPGADAKIPLLRAPADGGITIERCVAAFPIALTASTANYVDLGLINGGTAQAGTAELHSATIGGTAGWAANSVKEMSLTAGSCKLTAGQFLLLDYAETGTVAPVCMAVTVEYVDGVGSKAAA